MKTVQVSAGGGYDILIQRGQLADCGTRIRAAAGGETAALICDGNAEQYGGDRTRDQPQQTAAKRFLGHKRKLLTPECCW